MNRFEVEEKIGKPGHGLFRIWWKEGGSSLAAVGCGEDGRYWFAPTNWVHPIERVGDDIWCQILEIEPIDPPSPSPSSVQDEARFSRVEQARDLLNTVLDELRRQP